jgi:hypothetical protein
MTEILKKKNKTATYLSHRRGPPPLGLGPAQLPPSCLLPRARRQLRGARTARRGATSTPRSPWASSRPFFTPRDPLWSPLAIPPLPVVARFFFLAISREPELSPECTPCACVASDVEKRHRGVQRVGRRRLHLPTERIDPGSPSGDVLFLEPPPDSVDDGEKFLTAEPPPTSPPFPSHLG